MAARKYIVELILFGFGAGVIAASLLVVAQNKALRAQVTRYKTEVNDQVQVGLMLPPLTGFSPAGAGPNTAVLELPATLGYGGNRKTLILVFEPGCGACVANAANWRKLLAAVDARQVRTVAVDMGSGVPSVADLTESGAEGAGTALNPSGNAFLNYSFRLTPQTILVLPRGRVEGVWTGALSQSAIAKIETDAGVRGGR